MDRVTNISWRAASGATLGGLASDGDVAGREWSAATGLINFRMRWYDAETGRWLSKDPIGLSGGLNLYAFCDCEAINFIDPYGNSSGVVLPVPLLLGPGLGPNWHHGGRSNRNKPLPLSQPIGDGWIQLPPWQSRYHDNGDPFPEKKFIHPDGREAVYDGKTGSLICDDDYGGTYNYVNPPVKGDAPWTYMWRSVGHFFSDMLPYYFWGN